MKRQIILASISPRRRELMKLLKIKFKAVDSGFDEVINPGLSHGAMVKRLALSKARAAAKKYPSAIIIAADTVVSFTAKIIGKPKDKTDAFKMLKSFKNKSQDVVTGVVVMDAAKKKVFSATVKNKIYFKDLSGSEILEYINSGESLDKAGGYGPLGKGMNLIKKIEGDYTTCLGLPLEFVFNSLRKLNVEV